MITAIYGCEEEDEFVREHKGLSFSMRKVCRLFHGNNNTSKEDTLGLTLLAPRALSDAQGVVVKKIHNDVDIGSNKIKKN